MQDVFALVAAVARIVANLLEQDFDGIEHDLSTYDIFGEALLLGFFNCLAGGLDRACECIDVDRWLLQSLKHGADFLCLSLISPIALPGKMAKDRVIVQFARGKLVLQLIDIAKRNRWIGFGDCLNPGSLILPQ
ncbi:hypothetical protein [Brucella intermedia]|uniref:hypothetical protein n=1 Tax=Brucella intermedia TaxID=94625 RepID=UPI00178C2845|nr:hypothetical protein [Brucella intermedia]